MNDSSPTPIGELGDERELPRGAAPVASRAQGAPVSADGSDVASTNVDRVKVLVYWRSGCPFCIRLRWGLRRLAIATEELDIWTDLEAAAFVRSVNGGNETVPTVVVGDVTMLNPTPRQVQHEYERQFSSRGARGAAGP